LACQKKFGLGFLLQQINELKINQDKTDSELVIKQVIEAIIISSVNTGLEENEEVMDEEDYLRLKQLALEKKFDLVNTDPKYIEVLKKTKFGDFNQKDGSTSLLLTDIEEAVKSSFEEFYKID
jgi:hypothetical protein